MTRLCRLLSAYTRITEWPDRCKNHFIVFDRLWIQPEQDKTIDPLDKETIEGEN